MQKEKVRVDLDNGDQLVVEIATFEESEIGIILLHPHPLLGGNKHNNVSSLIPIINQFH